MIKLQYNYKYTDPDHEDWTVENPLPAALEAYDMKLLKWYPRLRKGDIIHTELSKMHIQEFLLLTSLQDGHVTDFMAKARILEADILKPVPEALINSKTTDVDNTDPENPIITERLKTWDEWLMATDVYTRIYHESYVYFLSYSGSGGFPLTGAQLLILHSSEAELVDAFPIIEEPPIE